MSENIEVSRIIPVRADRIFDAWLSGDEHGKMIGSSATVESDGHFTAWDGYITGTTLAREPYSRILQGWRTTEFPPGAPDSQLEVLLEDVSGGTKITLKHTLIPDGQGQSYAQGWNEHYFDPMLKYFETPGSKFKDAGDALGEMMTHTGEALEAAGAQAKKTFKKVQKSASKTAKKTASKVKALVAKAKKSLAKRKPVKAKAKAKPKNVSAKSAAKKKSKR
jgi:uncharacterized protein YndB with AHSA1/START domain